MSERRPDPLDAPGAESAAARGGAVRAAAWATGAALSLVSIPLLVRHLGLAEFGRYVTVLSIVSVAALASDFGLGSLALREWGAARQADRPAVLRTLLGLRLAFASVAAVVALAFALAAGYPGKVVAGAAIASVGLFAQVFGDFALVALAGSMQFGRVAAVELTRSALGTAGIVILVATGAGLVPFFAAYSVAAIVAALLALRLARTAGALVPRFDLAAWRPLIADTAVYAAATAVYVVYFRVVMLVVSLEGTAREAGLFAAAYRVVEFTAAVGAVLAATATPLLARRHETDVAELRRSVPRLIAPIVGAGVAVAVVLAAGAPVLMDVIGGSRTQAAVPVMRIMAPVAATTFAAFGMGAVLLVMRRYRELLAVNVVALAVAAGLALALVPGHGARGAAWATLAGELVAVVGQLIALLRAFGDRAGGYHRPGGNQRLPHRSGVSAGASPNAVSTLEQTSASAQPGTSSVQVSVVIPCLNEAANIVECVTRARRVLDEHGLRGEVVVADNGSDDGSAELAKTAGALVVHEPRRGYGSAYLAGFAAARGDYVVMADADLTYDWNDIPRFVTKLDEGAQLVMGDRMDNIHPGAMPWLHRYVGNPILSGILNVFFRTGVRDAHCGMRGFRRDILPQLDLRTTGMEFASEMVIRASKERLDIRQIPIEYHPRGGESKLSSFRDGWRHLRFLLVHSPTHLFLIPGVVLLLIGALVSGFSLAQVSVFGRQWQLHSMIVGSLMMIVGTQIAALGLCAHAYGMYFMGDRDPWFERMRARFRLEHGLALGGGVFAAGLVLGAIIVIHWAQRGFGVLSEERLAVFAAALMIVGLQVFFSSFLLSILGLRRRNR
jgi:O-antigen/teichoic acid export membrane protein